MHYLKNYINPCYSGSGSLESFTEGLDVLHLKAEMELRR